MSSPEKKPMDPDKAKAVAMMLVCPHQWGTPRKTRVVEPKRTRDGELATCKICGTHRVVWPEGTATLYSPEALSTEKPKE